MVAGLRSEVQDVIPSMLSSLNSTLSFTGSHSCSGGAGGSSLGGLLREVALLREHCAAQECQLEELAAELEEREAENDGLRHELNLERFKYELLVDLWASRVLDNE